MFEVPVRVRMRWRVGDRATDDREVAANEKENARLMVKQAVEQAEHEEAESETSTFSGMPGEPYSVRLTVGRARRID